MNNLFADRLNWQPSLITLSPVTDTLKCCAYVIVTVVKGTHKKERRPKKNGKNTNVCFKLFLLDQTSNQLPHAIYITKHVEIVAWLIQLRALLVIGKSLKLCMKL